jgi:hypothetical protein
LSPVRAREMSNAGVAQKIYGHLATHIVDHHVRIPNSFPRRAAGDLVENPIRSASTRCARLRRRSRRKPKTFGQQTTRPPIKAAPAICTTRYHSSSIPLLT